MQSRVAERIELKVNVEKLLNSFQAVEKLYPAYVRSQAFGGWALQGLENPTVYDGWSLDFCPFNGPDNRGPTWTAKNQQESRLAPIQAYNHPTPAMTPELQELIQQLQDLGLNPRRAKILRLMPNSSLVWHQDGSSRTYQAKIHIPLTTNSACFFETDMGRYHMPADGAGYFVHINRMHRAVNGGDKVRLHFAAHIWDQNHISKYHQYRKELYDEETVHPNEFDLNSIFDFKR